MASERDNVFTSIGAMLPDDVIAELGLEPYSDDARQHPRDVAQVVTRLCDGLNAARARAERAEARLAEVKAATKGLACLFCGATFGKPAPTMGYCVCGDLMKLLAPAEAPRAE